MVAIPVDMEGRPGFQGVGSASPSGRRPPERERGSFSASPCSGPGERSERAASGFLVSKVVRQDLRVVEGEGGGEVALAKESRLGGVVAALGGAFGAPDVDRRDRVVARVACRVGVNAQQGGEGYAQARLLQRLPDGGGFDGFTDLDEPAGD